MKSVPVGGFNKYVICLWKHIGRPENDIAVSANITTKTGKIVGAKINDEDTKGDLMIMSKNGVIIRMNLKSIPSQGRTTQGVYLMRMSGDDKVASTTVIENDGTENPGDMAPENQPQLVTEAKGK